MPAMEDAVTIEEIKPLLERMVILRLDVIAKELEDLRKQSEVACVSSAAAWAFWNPAKKVD